MPGLPQELIDAIIELVPDSSLGACSMTATAFVVSSQRRLFRWMSLSNMGAYERTAVLLVTSPHLGAYVRYVAMQISSIPADYIHLKSILARLSELERVSIVGYANAAQGNQLALNPCLIDLLSLPSLRCIALHHLSDVPSSLIARAFASFEQVSLSHLSITNVPHPTAGPFSVPRDLSHLRAVSDAYETIYPFVFHAQHAEYLKKLTRLSFVFPPVPQALETEFTALLSSCSATLNSLETELGTSLL
jgi:hypothetical protein